MAQKIITISSSSGCDRHVDNYILSECFKNGWTIKQISSSATISSSSGSLYHFIDVLLEKDEDQQI